MVGHYHKCIQFYKWKMVWNFNPIFLGDISYFRRDKLRLYDFAKETMPIVGADGYKIGRVPAVVPGLQTGGGDAVFVLVFIGHCFVIEAR